MDERTYRIDQFGLNDLYDSDSGYISIIPDDKEKDSEEVTPEVLPILPLRNSVLFPGIVTPIGLGRDKSKALILESYKTGKLFGAIAQKSEDIEDPTHDDLYSVGTMAKVVKILEMPDGSTTAIVQGKERFVRKASVATQPYLSAEVNIIPEIEHAADDSGRVYEALIGSIRDLALRIIKYSKRHPEEASFSIRNIDNSEFMINFISSNAEVSVEDRQHLLEIDNLQVRAEKLLEHLTKEVQLLELKNDIQSKARLDIDQQQREYLLQQQMKTIQNELGPNPVEQEIEELRELAQNKKWSSKVAEVFENELSKLERLNPSGSEYSVQYNYLQVILDLPWDEYTKDKFDMRKAQRTLDKDHFGLDGVKERILEHLAVLKLKGDLKSPIICLHGPPGVGKTSLGKSVAEALGRKYARMSLGGLHDESEIRGHRRTYIGAMPGRILHNIKKAGSSNPVFILDEIDKVNASAQGDPAAALLEVLDPEQNSAFHDNFLEIDYDLSKVLFIATANSLSTISRPLLDRMELIDVSGYIIEEKLEIAKRHLWPKQLENHGLEEYKFTISQKVMTYIVESYTSESGVRGLDKILAKIARKIALRIAKGDELGKVVSIADVKEYLGVEKYSKEKWQDEFSVGVVTGLAWTAVGGEILFVESSTSKGKGSLTITGNLGDVMKESAMLALQYIKSNTAKLNISDDFIDNNNFHIHVPEGAIPKDGPSAGITIATSLVSSITGRKVRKRIAMTGEITLRGKVLPVGGIKEKILAAKRAGINEIIISKDNKKDVNDINEVYVKGLQFHYVDYVNEVLKLALEE